MTDETFATIPRKPWAALVPVAVRFGAYAVVTAVVLFCLPGITITSLGKAALFSLVTAALISSVDSLYAFENGYAYALAILLVQNAVMFLLGTRDAGIQFAGMVPSVVAVLSISVVECAIDFGLLKPLKARRGGR